MYKREQYYKGNKCDKCESPLTIKNRSGFCRSCRMLGNKITLGRIRPYSERLAISISKLGSKNPNWKGDRVGRGALHDWVKEHLPKSDICSRCGLSKKLDLANVSQKYKRDLTDWEWLCRKCHMFKDDRLQNLKKGLHKGITRNHKTGKLEKVGGKVYER